MIQAAPRTGRLSSPYPFRVQERRLSGLARRKALLRQPAAVDGERHAVDVRRLVAREVQGRVRDVTGDAHSALRDDRAQAFLEGILGEIPFGQRRPDQARADRVDADPGRAEVAGQALRQADHPVLRRRVRGTSRETDQTPDGRDVHDRAPTALAHRARGGLAAVERAAQVDRDHVVPLLARHRVDVADLADPGAVHEDVDAPLGRHDVVDSTLDLDGEADVAVDRHVARQVEAGHTRALAPEALSDLAADAARGPRHEHYSVLDHSKYVSRMGLQATVVSERPADRPSLLEQYRLMALIRRFEDRAAELFQQGVIFGTAHSCVGQEAIAVGAAGVMRDTDYLVGHHRSHGHLIAAGADLRRMMAEMFGKRTGYCNGLGGSMHIADLSLQILGCNGIVGAGLPHACGAALTATLHQTGQAAVAFFGDGAAGQGAAHEAMNLAATWTLPVVFICENNQFALSADWRTQRAVEDLADRAAGYGMAAEIVDGNELLAVEDAVARALARAREGAGPTFLEMKTFRRMQHSMRANLPDVRDPALVEEWEAKDPLPRLERVLRDLGELDDDRVEPLREGVERDVEHAIETALADEDASPDDLLPAVFGPHRGYPAPAPASERKLGFIAAVREALDLELEADPSVIVIGEDIGKVGGLFRATEGLYERYGAERIRDTPLTESGFVGCGIGAALTGLRPVVELQFSDFAAVAFDQIVNQAAKLRFMMGGTPSIPLVIRMVSGGGVRLGAQHSQSLEALFAHIPGLVVAMPSSPFDAKGLLSAAIRDDNPVIFLEQKLLFFGEPAPVPPERYGIELGVGRVAREGDDVTVVALGALVPHALRAAHELEGEGVSVEVVDPRTIVPLDTALIAESVAKTHRLVVAHEAVRFCGIGSEIAAHVAQHCFWDLDAPVVRVGAASHPIPYQKDLELATLPGPGEIRAAVQSLVSG